MQQLQDEVWHCRNVEESLEEAASELAHSVEVLSSGIARKVLDSTSLVAGRRAQKKINDMLATLQGHKAILTCAMRQLEESNKKQKKPQVEEKGKEGQRRKKLDPTPAEEEAVFSSLRRISHMLKITLRKLSKEGDVGRRDGGGGGAPEGKKSGENGPLKLFFDSFNNKERQILSEWAAVNDLKCEVLAKSPTDQPHKASHHLTQLQAEISTLTEERSRLVEVVASQKEKAMEYSNDLAVLEEALQAVQKTNRSAIEQLSEQYNAARNTLDGQYEQQLRPAQTECLQLEKKIRAREQQLKDFESYLKKKAAESPLRRQLERLEEEELIPLLQQDVAARAERGKGPQQQQLASVASTSPYVGLKKTSNAPASIPLSAIDHAELKSALKQYDKYLETTQQREEGGELEEEAVLIVVQDTVTGELRLAKGPCHQPQSPEGVVRIKTDHDRGRAGSTSVASWLVAFNNDDVPFQLKISVPFDV